MFRAFLYVSNAGKGIANAFVEVEIQGAEYDSDQICRTRLPRDLSAAQPPSQATSSMSESASASPAASSSGSSSSSSSSGVPAANGNAVAPNGFNPVWNQRCIFEILNPQLAVVRFAVFDDDSSAFGGGSVLLAQAAFPVSAPALVTDATAAGGEPQWTCALRPGFRSVPLYSPLGERIELASLLVYIDSYNPKVSTPSICSINSSTTVVQYVKH